MENNYNNVLMAWDIKGFNYNADEKLADLIIIDEYNDDGSVTVTDGTIYKKYKELSKNYLKYHKERVDEIIATDVKIYDPKIISSTFLIKK